MSNVEPGTPYPTSETITNRDVSRNGRRMGRHNEKSINLPVTSDQSFGSTRFLTEDSMSLVDSQKRFNSPPFTVGPSVSADSSSSLSLSPPSSRTHVIGSSGKIKVGGGLSQPASPQDSHTTEAIGALLICGICQENLLLVANPLEASLLASASSGPPRFGLRFLCPGRHMYCLDCSSTYIRIKLQETGHNAFPMRCPECPRGITWQIDDETARKLLRKELLDTWYSKRLLATISNTMLYCPNLKCSEPIDTSDIVLDVDRTECPACHTEICLKCRTIWHIGLSCEDAENPLQGKEALQRLATRNQWRRCPQCRTLVERSEGCNHMVCLCGGEFCFACGANYAEGGCTWTGGCDGEWQAETDWTERAEEAVKQQGLLSRLKNIQWLGKNADSKADDSLRPRAWSWSKTRTSPSPPPSSDPDTELPGGSRLLLPFRRLRMSRGKSRAPELDMLEVPQDWRISQNWVVVPQDSDPEDPTTVSALAPRPSIRRNRRSAPPIIITGPSESGHTRNAASSAGVEVPAHRMKPLPPLPSAPDSQPQGHS